MTICSEHETTFWMDIHRELGPEDLRVWENHLAACDACRNEKVIASKMMGQIKETLMPQPFSNTALTDIVDRIAEKAKKSRSPSAVPKHRWFMPGVVFPALTAACLLLMAIGFIRLSPHSPDSGQTSDTVASLNETIETEDLEIIENMDLLTEFETLQELVQMMEDQKGSPKTDEQTQGKIEGGGKLIYG